MFVYPFSFSPFSQAGRGLSVSVVVLHMCGEHHLESRSFHIPASGNDACDAWTFLSGTRRALRVARMSVSHAASHSIFIGVNIQLTSESLV